MFNIKSLFKKEEKQRSWYSYRWDTFWLWETIETTLDLYYKLYRENTDLRRCIEELYQTTWKEWWQLLRWETPVNNIDIENQLNYWYWFNTFKSIIIRDLQVAWNVFIIPIWNPTGRVIWYQVLDPRTMRVIANKFGEVIRYIQVRGWNQQVFMPNEIYHFKDSIDHDNEVFWISKVETLVYDILADKESGRSNYAFFKNNAIPSTIITLDNELDENEINIALAQLKKQFSWWENRHRVSASTGIKDIKVIWNSIKDMEFVALRQFTTERICSAMWVPKTILWYSNNVNYSTSDNQYRKFIENTIKPLELQFESIINTLIIDSGFIFEFKINEDYWIEEKINKFERLLNIGAMTINEIRAELWFDLYNSDIADQPIIKSWYTLIDDIWIDTTTSINKIPDNE